MSGRYAKSARSFGDGPAAEGPAVELTAGGGGGVWGMLIGTMMSMCRESVIGVEPRGEPDAFRRSPPGRFMYGPGLSGVRGRARLLDGEPKFFMAGLPFMTEGRATRTARPSTRLRASLEEAPS